MWPYPWTHVGTPSHLGHMDRVAATMPSQAHAGAAQEAPDIGQWEGQDLPLVRPSSCNVKGGIPSSRRYLPTYLSRATWLLFMGVPARRVVLCVWCPGPLGSCSPVCLLVVLFCLCGVLGNLDPADRCACSVCCLCLRCPRPLGSRSTVLPVGALPVCAVSRASWLLFTGVPAWCVVLLVRCLGPLGSCSPACPLSLLCCVCGVLGHSAPVLRCARSVCCVACAVSWAPWLLFTGVPARRVVWRVRCPGLLGSCSPVCLPSVLCSVLGHLAPVHRCARSVCCAVGCGCGASLRGAHSSIRTVAICSW